VTIHAAKEKERSLLYENWERYTGEIILILEGDYTRVWIV
jgi:hypothetical protein